MWLLLLFLLQQQFIMIIAQRIIRQLASPWRFKWDVCGCWVSDAATARLDESGKILPIHT
jgi:hypothetical protein